MIEPLPQRLVQRDDARRDAVDQHIHIDGKARLQFESLNSVSIISAGSTFFARGSKTMRTSSADSSRTSGPAAASSPSPARRAARSAAILHAIGYFRTDGEPAAARLLFLVPAGAQPERTAPGAIGFDNVGALVDDNAAVGKSGPCTKVSNCSAVAVRWPIR